MKRFCDAKRETKTGSCLLLAEELFYFPLLRPNEKAEEDFVRHSLVDQLEMIPPLGQHDLFNFVILYFHSSNYICIHTLFYIKNNLSSYSFYQFEKRGKSRKKNENVIFLFS